MDTQLTRTLLSIPIGDLVLQAVNALLLHDRYLLEHDVNERSITHRLAIYLQEKFPDYHVDCEYNRLGDIPKVLHSVRLNPDSADSNAQTVFPDVIVHKRGTADNLLVIELKKSTSRIDRSIDGAKLVAYKEELGYQFALFIELKTNTAEPYISIATWV